MGCGTGDTAIEMCKFIHASTNLQHVHCLGVRVLRHSVMGRNARQFQSGRQSTPLIGVGGQDMPADNAFSFGTAAGKKTANNLFSFNAAAGNASANKFFSSGTSAGDGSANNLSLFLDWINLPNIQLR